MAEDNLRVVRASNEAGLSAEERWIARVAATRFPVLILGESGAGKERVARAVHDGSPRARRPFVALNCAALPETLLEAELFGVLRGAYTGADRDRPGLLAAADGGSLFLDEIGDLPRAMQPKLLRFLQEGSFRPVGAGRERRADVRLISATHCDLVGAVRDGRFRQDLYFRIAVLDVHVRPLRERRGEIRVLARRFLERYAAEAGLPRPEWTAEALQRLEQHDWPGNVRELQSVVARALLRCEGPRIGARDLDGGLSRAGVARGSGPLERTMISEALARHGGNVTRAARCIGWTRQKLYRRLRALELER